MFKKIYKSMRFVSLFALVISALMVFSTAYYMFNLRIENEIKAQVNIIADFINANKSEEVLLPDNLASSVKSKSIALVSDTGEVLFVFDEDENFDYNSGEIPMPDVVAKAKVSGVAESEKYKSVFLEKVYSYAVRLNDDSVLLFTCDTLEIAAMISDFAVVVVFMGILIFIFTALISKKVTENIVAPIESTTLYEIDEQYSPYEELKPFISKIAYQSREIKHQIEKVKQQKLRLQTISESMSEGLIVLDKDGNILSLNNSAMSFFEVSDKDVLKRTSIVSLTGKDTEFTHSIIHALQNNKGSFVFNKNDKTFEIFYSPVVDDGKVIGVVILMFDMTERLRNEQIRTEFTANVSHELKTPLTSIHGYAQLLSSGMARTEDVPDFSKKIEKESRRLISLVEDIIELSNLDEGIQSDKTTFNIHPMILEIAENLRLTASKRDIELSVEGADFEVTAESMRIHELLYNIIDNAVKYNKDSGNVKIHIGSNSVVISDTGIGIPDEYKERIFERFFRVDKSHSKTVNGTGLGLSIVKHIAMNNNIQINVESELGKGTVFTLHFPD